MKYHRRARRRRRRDDRTARARGSDAAEQPGGVAKCTSQTNPVCACDVLLCVCVCVFQCLCIGEGCLKKKRPTLTHAATAAWSSAAERSSYPNPTINILATRTTSGGIIIKKIKINVCVCVCVM